MSLATLLLLVAFVLFVLAAFSVNSGRANLTAAGLACCVLSVLVPGMSLG